MQLPEAHSTQHTTSQLGSLVLYLYLYAANSNYRIDDSEIDMIRQKMEALSFTHSKADFGSQCREALTLLKSHNEYTTLQYVEKNLQQLTLDKAGRMKLYKDVRDIMGADGEKEAAEEGALLRIKHMLSV